MRSHLGLFASLCLAATLSAQPKKKDEPPKKALDPKEAAVENLKKVGLKDSRVVESENLVLASVLAESKAKSTVDAVQKTFTSAAKALKFEESELKTKWQVYVFPDVDGYRQFQRTVLKNRPDSDEFTSFDVKRDDPFIAVSPRRGETANFEMLIAGEVSKAMLTRKGGNARLTEWMKDGFARAVQMRSNPASVGTDRTQVMRLAPKVGKSAKGLTVVDKAWSGTGKEKDLIAASLMDFFTFGSGQERFGTIVSGLIPGDNDRDPTFMDSLRAAEIMVEDLDREWREWIAKGSPVAAAK